MNKINYTILPSVLPHDQFVKFVAYLRQREHEYCDVNGLGFRWRSLISWSSFGLLDDDTRNEIAKGLRMDPKAVRCMRPVYVDSVLRGPGNSLDVHNDMFPEGNLEDRRIAFVYYCNLKWRSSWGGETILLDGYKSKGRTVEIKIPPIPNTLLAFEVTRDAWHCVDEIKDPRTMRHTVVGWLNGSRDYDPEYVPPPTVPENTRITLDACQRTWIPNETSW